MADASKSVGDGDQSDPIVVQQVGQDRRSQVLNLLLTGRAHGSEHDPGDLMGVLGHRADSPHQLWAAFRRGWPVGATLILPAAGRTAMCFVCPVLERASVAVVAQLVRQACSRQDARRVRLIQTLLDPAGGLEAESLTAAGFVEVACLQYMQVSLAGEISPWQIPAGIEVLTWNEQRRNLFNQAILASYEDTLDCPALLGVRGIDDVVASHMAVGRFVPDLWCVWVQDDQPVAVMLQNLVYQRDAVELVYLGVSASWRRRGLAKQLMRFGLAQARAHDASTMILAVDESNTPAKQLYRDFGFVSHTRKLAMIFTLP